MCFRDPKRILTNETLLLKDMLHWKDIISVIDINYIQVLISHYWCFAHTLNYKGYWGLFIIYHILFIHSSAGRHVNCLLFLNVVTIASIKLSVKSR